MPRRSHWGGIGVVVQDLLELTGNLRVGCGALGRSHHRASATSAAAAQPTNKSSSTCQPPTPPHLQPCTAGQVPHQLRAYRLGHQHLP
eukprot:357862-Chlamydomonas_euryale.AAC.3